MNSKELGTYGEEAAVDYLQKHGYHIIERNFYIKFGEIDIIAKKGDVLSFCEVKTRTSSEFGLPCEAVNFKKQAKIRQVAALYIQTHLIDFETITFDVIEVYFSEKRIEHLKNVF